MNAPRAVLYSVRENPGRWLLAAGCLALAATFLYPYVTLERPQYRLLFVLDVSQSMNATDRMLQEKPVSRIAFAREILRETLRELPCGAQAGLGLFTEYRTFLLLEPVEVCTNYSDLAATLDRLDYRMAWAGGSEISKGIFFGLRIARSLQPPAALVFVTDGHEAPPLHPKIRPEYEGKPGEVQGLLVGVGGDTLVPIPKFGADGQSLGYWTADEVMQTDVYTRGRGGSVAGESMVEQDPGNGDRQAVASEHLTSLKEPHLRRLASELGLGYHRLESAPALVAALDKTTGVAQGARSRVDLRWILATATLIAIVLMFVVRPARQRHA